MLSLALTGSVTSSPTNQMETYKVIKEEGVRRIDGKLIKKGETFRSSPRSASVKLQIRCKEIELVQKSEDSEQAGTDNVLTIEEVKKALTDAGTPFAANLGEKKLRALLEQAGTDND